MAERGEARLAQRLLDGVAALREGRLPEAIDALGEVVRDEDLASANDLRDVRARALSLLGDALLRSGDHAAAASPIQEAMSLLAALGDHDGHQDVGRLWGAVVEGREREQRAKLQRRASDNLRRMSAEDLRARFRGLQLADALVKKANAELDHGRHGPAASLAREALEIATVTPHGIREEVFARISLARALPEQASELLDAAWHRAEHADEFNLVSAIARAADALGIALAVQIGPDLSHHATWDVRSDGDRKEPMG